MTLVLVFVWFCLVVLHTALCGAPGQDLIPKEINCCNNSTFIRASATDFRVTVAARAARATNERNLKETRKPGNPKVGKAFPENTKCGKGSVKKLRIFRLLARCSKYEFWIF